LNALIKQDKAFDNERNRALLKSLNLAVVPSKAKPGSIQALIDDLVDYSANTGTIGVFAPEERYWRIARLGFDAVPDLIEHLDDDRLTRAMMMGFNNFQPWHLRVKDVVGDLLNGLAGEALMRAADDGEEVGGDWLRRQQGYSVAKAAAKKWWEKARKVGEERYLMDQVLPEKAKEDEQRQISSHLLNVIVAKCPKHIPSVYREILDKRPELYSGMLAGAVLQCKLPDKDKLALFLYAARQKDYKHSLPAFYAISQLDKKQFNVLLLAAIEGLPNDVPGEYWKCPEAALAKLAIESDDPRVWQTLERVAKRSAIGLRMELLNEFSDPKDWRQRAERLRLLSAFLDDAVLRDNASSEKFDGPGAGHPYDKISVRDFAALEIARIVSIDVETNLERTPEEWAKIRSQVQEALKHELSKAK
jgi:hypothetical protein